MVLPSSQAGLKTTTPEISRSTALSSLNAIVVRSAGTAVPGVYL
jgi:hypothetical protein